MSASRAPRLPRLRSFAVVATMVGLTMAFAPTINPARPAPQAAVADVDSALLTMKGAVPVILQAADDGMAAERAVAQVGGTVRLHLPIINGLAATVSGEDIPELAATPGVRAITLDRRVTVQGGDGSSSSNSVHEKVVRADDTWANGVTGAGVTVAVLDTGIADVGDLAGRILPVTDDLTGVVRACQNLSGESGCGDSYGHGTFIAGIIAGSGAASGGTYRGVAPGANLVSIKVAGRDGSSDVSTVIAGIQWAVSFADRYNIKVLNLSLGTDGTQTYRTDPLNYAVEKAWESGIAVVVAASNRGPGAGTISKPGDDPWVITVGAVDDKGTAGLGDDSIPNFSSRGPTAADGLAKPDVVAPGSAIDTQFPNYIGTAYRKGSGTSMATGVVSGGVALMLQANPGMSPDRVKYALAATARSAASTDPMVVGAGLVDLFSASFGAPPGVANQGLDRSNGLGSLDASRGTVRVRTNTLFPTIVSGLLTAQLLLWNPVTYTTVAWTGSSWYGSSWYGSSWYGSSWYGSSWYGSSWYGSSWYGQPEGSSWYGSSWYGSSWYGAWE